MLAFNKFIKYEGTGSTTRPSRLGVRFVQSGRCSFFAATPDMTLAQAERLLRPFVKEGDDACVICGDEAWYLNPKKGMTQGLITWDSTVFTLQLHMDE